MATDLPISQLRVDGGTQPRAALDFDAVDDYADAMADGEKFPPVVVYYDGENYWLADGFHRVKAAWQAGRETITAEVRSGTLEDARWHSFSANKTNGLRRTNDDKQRAVKGALQHARGVELSDREIGRHVGVDHVTVSRWREKLCLSGEIHQIDSRTRTVVRKGKQYEQDTDRIGRGFSSQARRSALQAKPAPATENHTTPPNQQILAALASSIRTIVGSPIQARDFVSWLVCQTEASQFIPIMENANARINEILSELREATRPSQ